VEWRQEKSLYGGTMKHKYHTPRRRGAKRKALLSPASWSRKRHKSNLIIESLKREKI